MDIVFDNIVNARDLGGILAAGGRPIRPHRLIRTAHLHDASDADIERLRTEYNLCRIFDFRSLGEFEAAPDREIEGVQHHLLPTIDMRAEQATGKPIPDEAFLELDRHIVNYSFYPEVQMMAANMYPSLIRSEFSQLQYAAFLRLIIEAPEDGGILWHCAQGKDRTGWGAAFLMFALGVEREVSSRILNRVTSLTGLSSRGLIKMLLPSEAAKRRWLLFKHSWVSRRPTSSPRLILSTASSEA